MQEMLARPAVLRTAAVSLLLSQAGCTGLRSTSLVQEGMNSLPVLPDPATVVMMPARSTLRT
jgi:hypothetical protein